MNCLYQIPYKILFILFLALPNLSIQCATITNACDASLLGDQLMNYIKANYLAHKYNIPFVLKPFVNSDKFKLYDVHPKNNTKQGPLIRKEQQLNLSSNTINQISYFCKIDGFNDPLFIHTWISALQDKTFMNKMRNLIALKHHSIPVPPKDHISVAVHIRKPLGGGQNISLQLYDQTNLIKDKHLPYDVEWPYKSIPDQYYIDQIKKVLALLPNEPIFIKLFSNSVNPLALLNIYKREIKPDNNVTMTIDTKPFNNYIAEDMIEMTNFNYLIRGQSNFSQISDFIGKHIMTISPNTISWYKNTKGERCLAVDTLIIKTKNENDDYQFRTINNDNNPLT